MTHRPGRRFPCLIPRCSRHLHAPATIVCGPCWIGVVRMCRRKVRLTETQARILVLRGKYSGVEAYECKVCAEWHTGHPNPELDMDHHRTEVAFIVETMTRARGQEWFDQLMIDWNPAHQTASHPARLAA